MAIEKVALVTGGSRGIGAAIVEALAQSGYAVAFSYRTRKAEAELLCERLRAEGREARAFACDVAQGADCDRLIAGALNAYGRLDALINNAGTHVPHVTLANLKDDDWARVIEVNLTAPFRMTRAVLPTMRKQGSGHIINLSSNVTTRMPAGYGVYAISKAGLEAFTRILSKEEGCHGIRVNAVGPGPIRTDMLRESFDVMGEARANAFVQSFALGR